MSSLDSISVRVEGAVKRAFRTENLRPLLQEVAEALADARLVVHQREDQLPDEDVRVLVAEGHLSGPPVPAPSPVNRRGWWGRPAAATSQTTSGWNYATSGAPPVTLTLPPDGPR